MKNEYYETPTAGRLMQLFWKAAGADKNLLERSTYSEQVKYFCMGGIVVATGVMAFMAGGYAFYTIFAPKDPINGELLWSFPGVIGALFFGLIWGAIIFNIDRFIVTSSGKGDGTEAITFQEIKNSIPRIIMGIIIALTISKPIEVRMFQTEIQTRLTEIKEDKKRENATKIEERFKYKLKEKDNDINSIQNRINSAQANFDKLEVELNDLQTGTGKYTGNPCTRGENCPTHSNLYKSKKTAYKTWISLKKSTRNDLLRLKKERAKIILDRNIELRNLDINAEGLNGLAIRIQLAEEVAGFWISFFITLLFMVIELTPIFFKMMLIKGPYDYMDENVKELAVAEYGIEITSEFYKDKNGQQINKVVNHAAEIKKKEKILLLKAQEELNEQIISKWKEKKSKEIDENPDDFVKEV